MSGINITRTHYDGFNPVVIRFSENKKYLLIPIEEASPEVKFYVINGDHRHIFNIQLAVKHVDYIVPLELTKGTYLELYEAPSEEAIGYSKLELSDTFDDTDHEYYRPAYHFTPKYGWMNDPNGLFYMDGVYHCYYQYNPYASVWGNMHWGHATTKDFIHYDHHPIALVPDELGTMFSGTIVIDKDNDSGFGKNAIVAFYTSAGKEDFTRQTICVAISTDGGFTFKKLDKNPIVTYDCPDFRDPAVIRYKNQWNLFVATRDCARIYSSKNLIDWKYESEFGHGIGCHTGTWECPSIFEVDGKWALVISTCAPEGIENCLQYFIGSFDGHEFKSDFERRTVKLMDSGYGSYATQVFYNSPVLTAISWMRYSENGTKPPYKQFRGALTIPRTFKIKDETLYSIPLPSFESKFSKKIEKISSACLVEIELTNVTAKHVFITLKNDHENVDMEINRSKDGVFYFNRGIKSGIHDFADHYCRVDHAPYHNSDHYTIKLFIDKHSIEIFDKEGEFSMTQMVFPRKPYSDVVIDTIDGDAKYAINIKTFE